MTSPPFGPLRFLYVGSSGIAEDVAYYESVLGAPKVWHFKAFGAEVAAFRVGEGPLVLLADHRPAPSVLPIFEVPDLDAAVAALEARGWRPHGARVEVPNGPCHLFRDPSGNELAIFEDARPGAMEGAFADAGNERAVR